MCRSSSWVRAMNVTKALCLWLLLELEGCSLPRNVLSSQVPTCPTLSCCVHSPLAHRQPRPGGTQGSCRYSLLHGGIPEGGDAMDAAASSQHLNRSSRCLGYP